MRGGKLPRRDTLREQNVQFLVCPAPRLRKAIISPNPRQNGCRAPYEAGVAPEIQRLRIEKVRLQHAREDSKDVIRVSGKTDRLLPEASRPDLRGERPPQLSHGHLERECPDEREAGLCHGHELVMCPDVQNPDQKQLNGHDEHAEQVQRASAHARHEVEPIHQCPEEREGRPDDVERVGCRSREADLFEEVRGVVGEREAREDLACETDACDLGAPELEAGKTVPVRRAYAEALFETVGVDYVGEGLGDVDV